MPTFRPSLVTVSPSLGLGRPFQVWRDKRIRQGLKRSAVSLRPPRRETSVSGAALTRRALIADPEEAPGGLVPRAGLGRAKAG